MLKEYSRLLQRSLFVSDLLFIAIGWIGAYFIRFGLLHDGSPYAIRPIAVRLLNAPEGPPALDAYLSILPGVMLIWSAVFVLSGLYGGSRAQRLPSLIFAVLKAAALGLGAVLVGLFFYRTFSFSRLHMLLFGTLTIVLMVGARIVLYYFVRRARQQGKYVRRVVIIGAGKTGRRLAQTFHHYPWIGLDVVGFFDDRPVEDVPYLGTTADVVDVLDKMEEEGAPVSYVYIALPLSASPRIEELVNTLARRLAHVFLVPDLFHLDIINSRITDIDGMPVIHLIDETPFEFRRGMKRAMDIAFSATFLLLAAPIMMLIAIGVKLSSPGPVFYKQQRMGLNGLTFDMLKFRSMPVDAEKSSGPVWAKSGESRATPFGSFLRRTSLDELPQFINVLKGDMSVVGPRPERPIFIREFGDRVPRYMLRHKMKAGITGWAQVHGWRGDTSIERRIEYDLYYIQNWSLKLDIKIMFMTLWKGFVNENAY